MQEKDEGKIGHKSASRLPLMLVSPADHQQCAALDFAVGQEKPGNFDLMFNMPSGFDEVRSSKLLMNYFEQMMGNRKT